MTDQEISHLSLDLGIVFPAAYREYLRRERGGQFASGVLIYRPEDLQERNQAWETSKYASGYLAVGDDGGGTVFLIYERDEGARVYMTDSGAMTPDMMEPVAGSWTEWETGGFRRRP